MALCRITTIVTTLAVAFGLIALHQCPTVPAQDIGNGSFESFLDGWQFHASWEFRDKNGTRMNWTEDVVKDDVGTIDTSSYLGNRSLELRLGHHYTSGPAGQRPEDIGSSDIRMGAICNAVDLSEAHYLTFAAKAVSSTGNENSTWEERAWVIIFDQVPKIAIDLEDVPSSKKLGSDDTMWDLYNLTLPQEWKRTGARVGVEIGLFDHYTHPTLSTNATVSLIVDDFRAHISGTTPTPGPGNNTTVPDAPPPAPSGNVKPPNSSGYKQQYAPDISLLGDFCLWPIVVFGLIAIVAPIVYFVMTRDHPLP